MIRRERYLNRIGPFINKPVIKVITGIRRSGKSTFLKMIIEELRNKNINRKNILYINKDSLKYEQIKDYSSLNDHVLKRFKGIRGNKFLFIDEIQEISEWEKAVASFYSDKTADLYITGSNARLLSSDLATLLTGRYIEFKINTLVFSEFLKFRKKTIKDKEEEFRLFLKYGGFPGIHHMKYDNEVISQYISSVYSTILLKDIVARNQIRDVDILERIVRYIIDNTGNITTAKGISNYIKSQHLTCAVDTVQNYITWLTDSYMAFKANRFDIKGKRILELYEKYYPGDIGFIFGIRGDKAVDISGKLENIVYLELLSRGYTVFIGKLYDREVDFIATKYDQKFYIQVAYLLSDEKVAEREFGVFSSIKDNYPKMVLSLDKYYGSEREGIKWFNIIDFLLSDLTDVL
ncbi:MAG: ATPase [Bacteroidetes bacterium RBG_19FT_COMBO_42_7]|nr:MAG: ATPase [Bacteroidetes bacterium RBG_13_42_15]OFY74114.1 MAG: ATPase [Bacteroidetes bacterium RBG_19FT_COMBO_42_7]